MPREVNVGPKIRYEKSTVTRMIKLYCTKNHGYKKELCEDCQKIHDYAQIRLTYCRFGDDKTTCQKCTVHCYSKNMREKIRVIMRYSGPRMIIYHPLFAIRHMIKNHR
ncbi:nitrous oxide-stimulated promoter family protein [Lactococcus allomyrinae]|uniref:Nitrous oxide-stimulated promoter family protein n=1 Tax=Lactococcus allomyrinae TaxID=2419773 RepID=A0A387BAS1_9LACT|nr:nitrous oxide-stimulated promoter family protein [Lactococcus allomyrinae]